MNWGHFPKINNGILSQNNHKKQKNNLHKTIYKLIFLRYNIKCRVVI